MSDKLAGGIKAGSTSVRLPLELRKASDSTELTGKVYTDVTGSYQRQGGTRTAITMATLSGPSASYSSGGFVEVDATNMPGAYNFDVPDAAFATGADWVMVTLKVSGAFVQTFMFALETKGAAEVSAQLPTALTTDGNIKADALRLGGTLLTGRDIGASVLLSSGTGTGQLSITSGVASVNTTQFAGSAVVATTGKLWCLDGSGNAIAPAATALSTAVWTGVPTGFLAATFPSTVSSYAGGAVASVTGAVGSVTARVTANTDQLAGQTVTAAAGVTFPTSVASPTNITAGTITTVTTLTNLPAAPTDWITAAAVKADAVTKIQSGLSTYAGADTAGTTTLLSRVTGTVLLASGYTAPDNTSITAIKVVTDHLATAMELNSSTYRFTSAALSQAPTSSGSGLSGPSNVTLTFHDGSGNPVAAVDFTVVGQGAGRANGSGVATFGMTNGTYSIVGRTTNGVIFPTTALVVSGSTSLTVTGAAAAISPPVDPAESTGYTTLRDGQGNAVSGGRLSFALVSASPDSYSTVEFSAVSDGTGLLQVTLVRGAKYNAIRRGVVAATFTVPDSSTFELPAILGT